MKDGYNGQKEVGGGDGGGGGVRQRWLQAEMEVEQNGEKAKLME